MLLLPVVRPRRVSAVRGLLVPGLGGWHRQRLQNTSTPIKNACSMQVHQSSLFKQIHAHKHTNTPINSGEPGGPRIRQVGQIILISEGIVIISLPWYYTAGVITADYISNSQQPNVNFGCFVVICILLLL